jgi:hypothetical protein
VELEVGILISLPQSGQSYPAAESREYALAVAADATGSAAFWPMTEDRRRTSLKLSDAPCRFRARKFRTSL